MGFDDLANVRSGGEPKLARFRRVIESLRKAFPPPVSDPMHDGYVVFSILRALDQVDALKSDAPILGSPQTPDYKRAVEQRLAEQGMSLERVIPELVDCLQGLLIPGHTRNQVNVVAPPSIASVIATVLPSIFNPNLCSDECGGLLAEAEVRAASTVADLVGYDASQSGGLFTFGGTGTLLYGVKIGLEKAVPGSLSHGLTREAVLICSEQSHYACQSVAGWLGIGLDQVRKVRTHPDNSIDLEALEGLARAEIQAGRRIAAIVATMGTTDAMGIDDLQRIHAIRERLVLDHGLDYRPHIHADAVIGWAWSVFNDYDFAANPLGFRGRTVRALAGAVNRIRHLPLADSLGADFHKTGFAPYIASLLLVRDRTDFRYLARARESMPYLFHGGEYHPATYTLETSRTAAGPMAALANLLLLGREGLAVLLGHAVEMAETLRELISARPELTVMNDRNFGPVTLFRAYPQGVDTFVVKEQERSDEAYRDQLRRHNEFNRRIHRRILAQALAGEGIAIGLTDCYRRTDYGEPIVALKSYVLSPFVDENHMQTIVEHVLRACEQVAGEMQARPDAPTAP
jgi:glutamate/tyrosine decarboxylase-like PLP-dependent enzyme